MVILNGFATTMDDLQQKIHNSDCIAGMNDLPEGSVDLVFADPPFNIGYKYDVYDDRMAADDYLKWSQQWISAAYRVLKPDGTFWLAIGDDFAAELKMESRKAGFHCRSWVIWYYTFGVNCSRKFTRSHTHLFHFVKDRNTFTFRADDPSNRVPSARQLVYNDRRADGKGRLPDDTWIIPPQNFTSDLSPAAGDALSFQMPVSSDNQKTFVLRPQDLNSRFQATESLWYFPRVAGTFQERAGFHGCQMPEQLLGRIIRTCSHPGELVIDPFAGSASTLIVAKKLGRRFIGFELSEEYRNAGSERLQMVRVGDPLVGSPEPTMSAPRTDEDRNSKAGRSPRSRRAAGQKSLFDDAAFEQNSVESLRQAMEEGVSAAFQQTYEGHTEDQLIADPERNQHFSSACRDRGLAGDPRTWNAVLLLRKQAGFHAHLPFRIVETPSLIDCEPFLYACEIAWRKLIDDDRACTIDEILCDPVVAREYDSIAEKFAPGRSAFEYRWAAIRLSQQAPLARVRGAVLSAPMRFGKKELLRSVNPSQIVPSPGVFIVSDQEQTVYVGEARNLQQHVLRQIERGTMDEWAGLASGPPQIQFFEVQSDPSDYLAWASCLITKLRPCRNITDLNSANSSPLIKA